MVNTENIVATYLQLCTTYKELFPEIFLKQSVYTEYGKIGPPKF